MKPSIMDLLSDACIKVNQNYIIDFPRNGIKNIDKESKRKCKIIKFSSEWKFCDVLEIIAALNYKEYPNLFIFMIHMSSIKFDHQKGEATISRSDLEIKNEDHIRKLKHILLRFCISRSMIVQLRSEEDNLSKIYFKETNSNLFEETIHAELPNTINIVDFSTFLSSALNGNLEIFQDQLINSLPKMKNSSIILRFLRAFKLNENFLIRLILKVAKLGTKLDLLSILDASFEDDGRMLSIEAQNWLSSVFNNSTVALSEDNSEAVDDKKISTNSNGHKPSTSILLIAIENKNLEIIDFLLSYWTFLIQQLPFEHQIQISTAALKTNQLDVLCELLELADYPFPENFKLELIKHHRIYQICEERIRFKAAIETENYEQIDEFLNKNLNLKFLFSLENNSALTEAIKLKKFGVFYYLKSLGYYGESCQDILQNLSKEEKEQAIKQARNQRKSNVNKSLQNIHKSILILSTKSVIHNRRTTKDQEEEYRKKIMKWYQNIFKVAPEMLNVAASCDHLKIIFDFESDSVENASLSGPNSLGSMYPVSKWIFIGAMLSDEKREQQIKGVLAHELCHYVMKLVYDNQENPYYKNRDDMKNLFEEIVKIIDEWSSADVDGPNDECFGIISTVFTLYSKEEFHLELIVRVVQILVVFDDNESECRYLQDKYKELFDFWYTHVVPEMQKYASKNKDVVKLNKVIGFLPKILDQEYKFVHKNSLNNLPESKITIITTNVPTLLFINIYEVLQNKYGILMDSQNFFTIPKKLKNQETWNDLKQICNQMSELNIFVDCTKEIPDYLNGILVNKELNYIFVVYKNQYDDLIRILDINIKENTTFLNVDYSWTDLSIESQMLLFQTEVNFQNNSNVKLIDLFDKQKNSVNEQSLEDQEKDLTEYYEIVDDQLFNLLLENEKIAINKSVKTDSFKENFEFLLQQRKYIWKDKDRISEPGPNKLSMETVRPYQNLSQEQFLNRIRGKKFVLISDKAGNGKSWAMRNFSKILSKQNPTNWVTYVDLKQLIDEFKTYKDEPEISSFLAEKILNSKSTFEIKIFQRLYKEGKVFILFDGFDEIAPTCAEFVSKLAQSFKFNGGNQLWIATRDYFEVDLTQKLQIDDAYGLNELSEDDGVNLIAKTWMLMDNVEIDMSTRNALEKLIRYETKARVLIRKIAIEQKKSVGMPQLYKMIADLFKGSEDVNDLKEYLIYAKFVLNIYKRWSDEKGKLRKNASIASQEYEMNFWKFHQYMAMLSLFPKYAKELFPGYDPSEWSEEEIVACGIMTKIGDKVFFVHESFREFFVADFVTKTLKSYKITDKSFISQFLEKKGTEDYIFEIFVDISISKNFNIIRTFLYDAINHEILEKIKPKVKKNMLKRFYELSNLPEFLFGKSDQVADFVIDILKSGDYKKIYKIINNSFKYSFWLTNRKMFLKLLKFICKFLNVKDLKLLIEKEYFFNTIIICGSGIEIFDEWIKAIEAKLGRNFVQNHLKRAIKGYCFVRWECSFFFPLSEFRNLNSSKLETGLEAMHQYLTNQEIFEFLTTSSESKENILMGCLRFGNDEYFRILWMEIKKCSSNEDFKKFIKSNSKGNFNLLNLVPIYCSDFKLYQTLWELLFATFEDRTELLEMIISRRDLDKNYISTMIKAFEDFHFIEWTFDQLKENFTEKQFQELIKTKFPNDVNLLQVAAVRSKSIEIHKLVWKIYRSCCNTDEEFAESLKLVNKSGNNILNIATKTSSLEVVEFILEELESKLTSDEFAEILSNSSPSLSILLHSAASNTSPDVLKIIWRYFEKYFKSVTLLNFLAQTDESGNGFFHSIFTGQALEFAIEELKKIASQDEIKRMLNISNTSHEKFLQVNKYPRKPLDFHEAAWRLLKKYFDKTEILEILQNVKTNLSPFYLNLLPELN